MSWNVKTLQALDKAIIELENSINSLNDNKLKSDLLNKIKLLKKTRAKMTTQPKLINYYLILIPLIVLFYIIGYMYFKFYKKE